VVSVKTSQGSGTGFLIDRDGGMESLRTWTKRELAGAICDRLVTLLG